MIATTTLTQIRTKVRTRLDDDSFEGNVIDEAVNNYIFDITGGHNFVFLEATATPPTVAPGSNTLTLPSDFQNMRRLAITAPSNYLGDLSDSYVLYNDFYRQYPDPTQLTRGTPSAFTEYGGKFVFNVPADVTYTFALDYMNAPALLVSDSAICIIPDEFIECVVDGATYRIQKRDDDYDLATEEKTFLTPKEIQLIKRYGSGRSNGRGRRMTGSLQARTRWQHMATRSALRAARTPTANYPDETYRLMGLNMAMPDQLITNGETPYCINSRMFAREDGQSRVPVRTRKGPGFYTIPIGETLDKQQTAVTGAASQTLNQSRRLSTSFVAGLSGPLTAIDLNLKQNTGVGTFLVEIRSDNAGVPGDLLAISGTTGNSIASTYGYIKFRFHNPAVVAATTKYWIVLYAQDDNTNFFQASSTTATNTSALSINSGGSWISQNFSLNYKTYVSAAGAIKGWCRHYYSNGTKRTLFAHGTTLYAVNDVDGTTSAVKTGLSSSATRYRYAKMNDKTIVVNGFDQPFEVDSALAVTTLTSVPFVPNNVVVWKNRAFFTQPSDPTRIFYSDLADETVYPSVNFLYAPAPKTADPITAMTIFQDNLIVFTSETKYIINGYDVASFTLRQALGTKGALAQEGITQDRNFIYFVSDDDIYAFNGATDQLLSDKVQPEVDGFADRSKVSIFLYNNQVRIYYPKASQSQNNAMLILDNVYKQWFMDTNTYTDLPGMMAQDLNNPLVEASSIYGALFYGEVAFSDLGAPLDFKYWTPYNKYLSAMSKDRIKKFHPELRPASITYTMQIGKDINFQGAPTMIPYVVESGGHIWGADTSIWGLTGVNWGGGEYEDNNVSLSGRGNHTQYRFERYGANTPVELYGYAGLIKSSRLK